MTQSTYEAYRVSSICINCLHKNFVCDICCDMQLLLVDYDYIVYTALPVLVWSCGQPCVLVLAADAEGKTDRATDGAMEPCCGRCAFDVALSVSYVS